ncbi:response regulator receiver modulated diguanylate cyclase [Paracidovorax anthurii]|uniref:diguanylate cyclase n=2 Tax=Paracidovorax anthurii TaxID=78229 RepID=A0A328YEM0_9BURK|nr:response regulator receiver modulated diguanylate cyclase [Paracidovorax anthurii]
MAHLADPQLPSPDGISVLLVDDQVTNIRMLHALLGEEFDIRMATSGDDALRLIHSAPPDLILLDIQMPGMSGYEVCRQLKASEDTRHIPVIFITAQNTPEDESLCFRVGAVDFIAKPINPEVAKARVRTHARLKRQSDLLRDLAYVDGLTGVANRRRFDGALDAEWRRCGRNGSPLSIVMIDVDNFKSYNDHYGHAAGDSCLQKVALQLTGRLHRSHDLVARYGGEEFVCLLPDCDLQGALAKAEALRQSVESLAIEHAASAPPAIVTISAGVCSMVPSDGMATSMLAHLADQHLYAAKSGGRNRVSG